MRAFQPNRMPKTLIRPHCGTQMKLTGRGVHSALQALLVHRRSGMAWIVQSDIQDFFDSVDHAILQAALIRAKIEPELVHLIGRFLTAGVRLGRRWFPSHRGLCQGSPVSPLLANFYLNPFDHRLQRARYELMTYADDLLVCCPTRHQAQQALDEVISQLARLKLTADPAKSRILNTWQESFEFLGFLVTPNWLWPSGANIQRFRATLSDLIAADSTLPLAKLIAQINPLIRSFRSFYQHCQVDGLFAALDAWIAARLTPHLKSNGTNNLPHESLYTQFGLEQLAAAQSSRRTNVHSSRPGRRIGYTGAPGNGLDVLAKGGKTLRPKREGYACFYHSPPTGPARAGGVKPRLSRSVAAFWGSGNWPGVDTPGSPHAHPARHQSWLDH